MSTRHSAPPECGASAVLAKRKVCGGSRSMDGLHNTADLLTVIQTCKAQGKSVVDFFRQALIAPSSISLIPILT
jgi:hypothetical protein